VTTGTAQATALPCRVRLLPARGCEPGYDDETVPAVAGIVDGSMPLSLAVGAGRRSGRRLRVVGGSGNPGPGPTRPLVPVPAKPWIARLVQALNEVLAGDRPLAQLAPYLAPAVYAAMDRRLSSAPCRRPGRRHPAVPTVRCLRVCEPRPGVAEVAAVVRRGERTKAMALRLEATNGRWRCTALQVG
jgi:Family of unknown function (DUF6459)